MTSIQQQARGAGFLYLLVAVIGPFGLLYVPSRLIVTGDATATANNFRTFEWLLRLGIGADLLHQAVQIFLLLALYKLFKPVSEALARQLIVLGALLSIPIMFINTLNWLAALILTSDAPFLSAFDRPQLDALAYLFVSLHALGTIVASIFWGLWLFPFGLLVIRSGFIPRTLGVLLIIAGAGYVADAIATLVLPQIEPWVHPVASALVICELPIVFWLVIWGARPRVTGASSTS